MTAPETGSSGEHQPANGEPNEAAAPGGSTALPEPPQPQPQLQEPVPPVPPVPPVAPAGAYPPAGFVAPAGAYPPVGPVAPAGAYPPAGSIPPTGGPLPTGAPGWQAPPPAAAKKRLGTGALVGIVGGGIGLIVIIALVVAFAIVPAFGRSGSGGGEAKSAGSATELVQGYLKAVAASDADTALGYLEDEPENTDLLTDKMLEASNKIAPITGITVGKPKKADKYSSEVTAKYKIGQRSVSSTYRAYRGSGGEWELSGGTTDLSFDYAFEGLDITVNGVAVEGDSADVFPGSYELATTTKYFQLTGKTTVVVDGPNEFDTLGGTKAELNDEGLQAYRDIVQKAVAGCLAAKTLEAGCGLSISGLDSDGTQMVDGTVTRTLSAEGQATLAGLTPRDSFSNPLHVTGSYIDAVDVSGECVLNGDRGPCSLLVGPSLKSPLVDFSTETPTVRWDE